jgi:HK97 family phage prohead protease
MKIKQTQTQVKASDNGDEGIFEAYASTFTREPDSYGDVVAKGAFADTLSEWKESGNVLPVLFGHNMSDPDYNIGAVVEAKEDDHGLLVKGKLDLDNPKAAQVYRLIKGKRINQMSFAFDVLDEKQVELGDGTKANELRNLKLYEVSIVPIGANQDTEILAVKAAVDALADGIKAGRVLSAKNEKTIADAVDQISAASKQLKDVLTAVRGEEDQEKASGHAEAKNEEPKGSTVGSARIEIVPKVKFEEPKFNPSARVLANLKSIELATIG